eukprot:c25185_g2_i1 orf=580-1740(+)
MILRATASRVAGSCRCLAGAAGKPTQATSFQSAQQQPLPCRSFSSLPTGSMETPNLNNNTHTPTRVLFCGLQFPSSFNFTKQVLLPHPSIQLDAIAHEEVPDKIENYDLCVVRMMQIDSSVIARAKQMKLFMQFGVGLEGVDIEAATKAGIKVARIPGDTSGNALSCAEHAIYLILALLRDQKKMESHVQQMQCGVPIGQSLFGKTVLIVGYGNIGKELALRLKAFGVHILATKRSWKLADATNGLVDEKGTSEQLLDFARKADIVVTCCSLTPETTGIINTKFLTALKKGAYIVNVARGGLLDYTAIKAALEANHLGGLGMDVAWFEPFDPADPILQYPNVILTPHIAGVTELSYVKMAEVVANAALHIQAGGDVASIKGIECVN